MEIDGDLYIRKIDPDETVDVLNLVDLIITRILGSLFTNKKDNSHTILVKTI